ncbi:hypothetical protein [Flavobacterium sp. 5]|uniref:hypothetical protein n=1 Tax=Flavobacterium sp. 5 TaxID=2035199 RepID=UPI000C2C997E|nr:hypothetical protein [Flavobacterium sp. 5]PKB18829.1 hypothetical protein CLU82_4123 [Flavobacterium sp. 5]
MATNEITTLEEFKDFASSHFEKLKPAESIYDGYILKIKVSGYSDMIRVGESLIKLCLHVVHTDALDNKDLDIGSVMELALQFFPRAETEVLEEIHQMLIKDAKNKADQ